MRFGLLTCFSASKFFFFVAPFRQSYCLLKRHSAPLTFSYILVQGKVLCFARIGMSLARGSEDLVQKIISPVIFDTNCSFKQ